ncbi:unnamed protein product [Mytilus edulis]|uniref:C2H2-type domain-containing protein n=1 Tax=Mytilus edulis TaxID=6550 RepID=A0A8S3TVB7_MYTED|nr:unnamed protein product [Mytilus edulis]
MPLTICRTNQGKGTIGINCTKCNKNFANLGTLKRHNRTFHEGTVQNFNCNTCEANFTRKYNIKKHIREKHNGTDQENYTETTGTPKQMATQVEKWVPPFEARKWDSTKKPTFRIIAGKSAVTYPEKKDKTSEILESDLYLSDSNSTINSQIQNTPIDWNKYRTNSYGYLTEKKSYHQQTYHQYYESWDQYTTNNYNYLDTSSKKSQTSMIDLTKDDSIIDPCTSNTTVC